jgi:hypothetical protein
MLKNSIIMFLKELIDGVTIFSVFNIYIYPKMNIQAIIFDKDKHSSPAAMKWLKKHHFAPIKRQHLTENYRRYRIREPEDFIEKSFRTIEVGDGSIKILMKDGSIQDIAGASDYSNLEALAKTVQKYILCYVKELKNVK